MLNIVIFGAPGSGKGTQSEKIVEKYGINHISTGDVLRAEIKNGTELGKTAKSYIDQGQLIPDELMIDILASVFDSFEDSKGVIFDGFPRTIAQAEDREIVTCYFRADGRITKRGNIIFMGITALLNYDCVTLLCSVDCSANISKDFFQCTLSFDVLVLSFLLVPVNQRRSL